MNETVEALQQQLNSPQAALRWQTVAELKSLNTPDALLMLMDAIKHADHGVRWRAANALADLKPPAALHPLIVALRDHHFAVRRYAALALGEIAAPAAVPGLLDTLLVNHDMQTHSDEVIAALVKIGQPAVATLIQALDHMHSAIRSGAARALQQLNWTPDSQQETILYAIAAQRWSSVRSQGAAAVPYLKIRLNDQDTYICRHAAQLLALAGDADGISYLLEYLESENRRDIFSEVADIGVQGLLEFLELLRDENGDQYMIGTGELAALHATFWREQQAHQPEASQLQWLFNHLNTDDYSNATIEALITLAQIPAPVAIAALVEKLWRLEVSEGERLVAALCLIHRGQPAVEALTKLLEYRRTSPHTIRRAIEILGLLKQESAIPSIINHLTAHYTIVRQAAAEALLRIGTTEALQALQSKPKS